ncbi:unnamed protein product [Cylindrotheca closterium]|uniref:Uncharacterized protein n=1 Tax=Cylindrotheca closterium TaxID=2856 RepID=A0AAD2CMG4_9STRA|nr:unnamed protein product [Cylindrotheca closterium]
MLKLAEHEIVMAMHEEYETNKTILEQSRANKQGMKDPKNRGIEAPLHKSEAAVAGYEKALGLKSIAEDLRQANQRIKELDQSVHSCLITSFDADRARALTSTDGSLLYSGKGYCGAFTLFPLSSSSDWVRIGPLLSTGFVGLVSSGGAIALPALSSSLSSNTGGTALFSGDGGLVFVDGAVPFFHH